jgi:hypothetical protein
MKLLPRHREAALPGGVTRPENWTRIQIDVSQGDTFLMIANLRDLMLDMDIGDNDIQYFFEINALNIAFEDESDAGLISLMASDENFLK